MKEWLGEGENKLSDWDISRDAPYFGFEIPMRRASTSTSGWMPRSATWPASRTCRQARRHRRRRLHAAAARPS
jgi:hypothetical protein